MCGRYVIAFGPETLVHGFSAIRVVPFPQRWNVTPHSQVPVIRETPAGERIAEPMRWGLVPHWAKDPAIGHKLNNARAEGIADKPSFGQAVRHRRCIIPASGFYEWSPALASVPAQGGSAKQPWYISPIEEPCFAFGGLFEAWRPAGSAEEDAWLLTCCIVTTSPNAVMAPIHDRMPVMLRRQHWAAWLSRREHDPAALVPLMQGLPAESMQAWPVARSVNRGSAEGADLIARLPTT